MAAVAGCTHGEIVDGRQRHRVDARDAVVSQRQRPQGAQPSKGQGARAQGLEADVPHGQGRQRTCDRGTQQPAEAKQWSSVQATLPSWRVGCVGEAMGRARTEVGKGSGTNNCHRVVREPKVHKVVQTNKVIVRELRQLPGATAGTQHISKAKSNATANMADGTKSAQASHKFSS